MKVQVVEYNSEWPNLYLEEAERLKIYLEMS